MAAGERVITTLSCTECKDRNYHFATSRKRENKLALKKFCRACGKYTPHKETK